MKKIISFILLCSLLMVCLAGCKKTPVDDTPAKQRLIDQIKRDAGADEDTVEFTADLLLQVPSAWMFAMYVKIADNNIYLNNILYEEVEAIDNPNMSYNSEMDPMISEAVSDKEYREMMQIIENCQSCYMLKSKSSGIHPQNAAIFSVDGMYYIVTLYPDGKEILQVHYGKAKAPDFAEHEANEELKNFFSQMQSKSKGADKIDFSVEYQNLHYGLKNSGLYDDSSWYNSSLTVAVEFDFNLATTEDWYKECNDKSFEALAEAFVNKYGEKLTDTPFAALRSNSTIRFNYIRHYSPAEEQMSKALYDCSSDYEIFKKWAELEYVKNITVCYRYSLPSEYFDE